MRGRKTDIPRKRKSRNNAFVIPSITIGRFKAAAICLEEACINNLVLRIHLQCDCKNKNHSKIIRNGISKINMSNRRKSKKKPPASRARKIQPKPIKIATYCLKVLPKKYSCPPRLNLGFKEFVDSVSAIKLPSADWGVVVTMNQNASTEVCLTNNKENETCVVFYENSPFYKIFIDHMSVSLLGCPNQIRTVADIEVLLNIIENLDPLDCVVSKM